ncbi:MAG: hypothetical protein C5B51_27820 [Terriglobia bacterium]|nr:MAG: hypothetical protein C5B51_27820 [Terriglobia bacterium]
MRYFLTGLIFLGVCTALPAQWLKIKTPGIPRKADGKPELTAPTPRSPEGKPDLSGLWGTENNTYIIDMTADLKPGEVRPWAAELHKERLEALDRDTPATHCLPGGPTEILGAQYRIIQGPNVTGILYASGAYRQVFTDGRALPEDPNPTWWGYSVGHWEGDTLVVESAGFNDRSWLDFSGHPHTEALRVTERFQRRDFGHMQLQITLDDPKTFTKPVTIALGVNFVPDTEMLEYVCNENEKDSVHLVGKASDEVKGEVKIGAQVLSRYAGNYQNPDPPKMKAAITVAGEQLMFSLGGKGAVPLTTLSETGFYFPGGFPLEFIKDDQGAVSHFLLHTPCGDFKFVRGDAAEQ